jgi:hypothetical protein
MHDVGNRIAGQKCPVRNVPEMTAKARRFDRATHESGQADHDVPAANGIQVNVSNAPE